MILVFEDADFYAEYTSYGVITSSYRLTPKLTAERYAEKMPAANRRKFFYGVKGVRQNIPTNPEFDGWPARIDPIAVLRAVKVSRETPSEKLVT